MKRGKPIQRYAQLRAWPQKYHAQAQACLIQKRWFHSKAEMRYGLHLLARQQNMEISGLEYQHKATLVIGGVVLATTKIDFFYHETRWRGSVYDRDVWDEFKGMETPQWKQLRNLWAAGGGPGYLRVTFANGRNRLEPYRWLEYYPAGKEPKL